MTFQQQILASFIGTLFGFIFAILLFFLTNAVRAYFTKRTLRKHLRREFEYDITLIQEWIDEVDKILRKITANDLSVFAYLRYTFFQRSFIQQAFVAGIMYAKLDNEDISKLNAILMHCDLGVEQYINSIVQLWQTSQMQQHEALRKFEFEKDELQKYKKQLSDIRHKLDK